MRDYGKVSPLFWTGATGKELRKQPEALIVAMYLMTSPHANMLGLYYMPTLYIAHETGLGIEGALKGLRWAEQVGFCSYDHDSEMVWVHEMAKFQIAESLKDTDKRCLGVQNEYNSLGSNPYLEGFFDKYCVAFKMTQKRQNSSKKASPLEAPSKPLASQEQEQEQEQENNICPPNGEPVPAEKPKENFKNEIQEVFEFWKVTFNKRSTTVLDKNRKTKIQARLKEGYTVEDIKTAIVGCSKSQFHIEGNHTDLTLICRDATKLDHFLAMSNPAQVAIQPQIEDVQTIPQYKVIEGDW